MTATDIESTLRSALPEYLHPQATSLARLLTETINGTLGPTEAQAQLSSDSTLTPVLHALIGQQLASGQSMLSFGSGNDQRGASVTISGDVAGGSVIKNNTITLNAPITVIQQRVTRPLDDQQQHLRAQMLRVLHTWITGVIQQSLAGMPLISLALTDEQEVTTPFAPWGISKQYPRGPIPPGTTITEIFDSSNGQLLILGAPGGGKTTLLLELAQAMLERAERDASAPMPIVFNLASWVNRRQPLADWLVETLHRQYEVRLSLGRIWVEQGQIMLLLDGLDEVPQEQRRPCVATINAYRHERGSEPLVVCSRSDEYRQLGAPLSLQGAITIQSLDSAQIESYLVRGGEALTAARNLLQNNLVLRELVSTPLMLTVLLLASRGTSALDLGAPTNSAEYQRRLFAIYVRRMLDRPAGYRIYGLSNKSDTKQSSDYAPQQTLAWLIFLARTLQQGNHDIFFVEQMQPDWLPMRQRLLYILLVATLVGVGGGLLAWAGSTQSTAAFWGASTALGIVLGGELQLNGRLHWWWRRRLFWGISVAVSYTLALSLSTVQSTEALLVGVLASFIAAIPAGLLAGLLAGPAARLGEALDRRLRLPLDAPVSVGLLIGGSIGVVVQGIRPSSMYGFNNGLVFALGTGLLVGLGGSLHAVETLRWSWRNGLSIGLVTGLASGLASNDVMAGFRASVVFGLAAGLTGRDIEVRTRPNQGMWSSARNALWGLVAGGVVAIAFGLLGTWPEGIQAGVVLALLWGLRGGLVACLQHVVLRVLLYRNEKIPGDYVRFLDYAADRLLLRRVGGGYTFIHRLLLEHFIAGTPTAFDSSTIDESALM